MRIVGVDAARSIAIAMAMTSHVWVETGMGRYVPQGLSEVLRFSFQIATPTFVLLFGTMLEIVYRPRWADPASRHGVAVRLVSRALQCWVLYAISIFTLFLVDDGYSLFFSIGTVLFMSNSPYTEILKFYAVVLALAPILLWLRNRWGLFPLVAVSLLWQAAWPLLNALPDIRHDLGLPLHAARIVKFLTGFGDVPLAGPSVMHGLTLIVAGLCLGAFLVGGKDRLGDDAAARTGLQRRVSRLLAAATLVAGVCFLTLPEGTFTALGDMSLRMSSKPVYFAMGAVMAVWLTAFCIWLADILTLGGTAIWSRLIFFGRTSMFTFAWGNILLYLVQPKPQTLGQTLFWTMLLLGTICLMSLVFDRAVQRSLVVASSLKRVKQVSDGIAHRLLRGLDHPVLVRDSRRRS
ncbi:OpgC domain-containing protein [Paracoccus hibiscisoli]|uniref:OpgC domain-containing protein n=1 Tax=Paracoccus hibiscisoli TaxID=2023261 RepID=UPI0023F002A8|nr:OpgC domain-containing protein [Paracoccus hibiscisoli]